MPSGTGSVWCGVGQQGRRKGSQETLSTGILLPTPQFPLHTSRGDLCSSTAPSQVGLALVTHSRPQEDEWLMGQDLADSATLAMRQMSCPQPSTTCKVSTTQAGLRQLCPVTGVTVPSGSHPGGRNCKKQVKRVKTLQGFQQATSRSLRAPSILSPQLTHQGADRSQPCRAPLTHITHEPGKWLLQSPSLEVICCR